MFQVILTRNHLDSGTFRARTELKQHSYAAALSILDRRFRSHVGRAVLLFESSCI